jgi:pSer/pThr/pTyr-binding forkhead associated (FHA) protein
MRFEISYQGGTTHEVELPGGVCVVGRDPGCDIVLNDSKCSRRHAVIEDGPGGLSIRDSASANGIYVNGRKVEKAQLKPGDTVKLGAVKLKLLP